MTTFTITSYTMLRGVFVYFFTIFIMSELIYTVIQHGPRKKHWLSVIECCLADSIYHLSNNPRFPRCMKSKDSLADDLGISRRSVFDMLSKLIAMWFIEKDAWKGLRTTVKRYDEFVECKNCTVQVSDEDDSAEFAPYSAENAPDTVQNLHSDSAEFALNNNIYNNNENNKKNNSGWTLELNQDNLWVVMKKMKDKLKNPPQPPPYFEEVEYFINTQSKSIPWIAYQVKLKWAKYYDDNHSDYAKLLDKAEKFGLNRDWVKAILKHVIEDPFWGKNIWSINKLLKVKDWEPYRVKMLNNMDYSNKSAKKSTVPDMWWWFI